MVRSTPKMLIWRFCLLEMQVPVITAAPQGPLVVVEGQSLSLNWTYNLNGNNFLTIFAKVVDTGEVSIAERLLSNPASIKPDFTGRITGNITDSFASITFLGVNSSTDSGSYVFWIRNFVNEATPARVTITVLGKCTQ